MLEWQPYVVDLAEEHVVGSPGGLAYVRSIQKFSPADYIVYRPGAVYRDGDSGKTLGQEAIFIATATLRQPGDPATVMVNRSEKEVRPGDRLMPAGREEIGSGYAPHSPKSGMAGRIISVMDGVTQIGQFSVVALDRGRLDGVERGHVLEIWQKGESIRDTVNSRFDEILIGPEQKAGVLMVFQIFDRVSFALVMKAERFIHVLDLVKSP